MVYGILPLVILFNWEQVNISLMIFLNVFQELLHVVIKKETCHYDKFLKLVDYSNIIKLM